MAKVKICGLTNLEDAIKACECGADFLGFIFIKETPRNVDADTVKNITSRIPEEISAGIGKVGLFKDEAIEEVARAVSLCDLDHVQLHGDEDPNYCRQLKEKVGGDIKIIKMFKVKDDIVAPYPYILDDYVDADYYVFDTFHPDLAGGTGKSFDWKVLLDSGDSIKKLFFIAGGLDPGNVREAVEAVAPFGVDVSSGVELEAGKKDENLLKEFIKNAKKI